MSSHGGEGGRQIGGAQAPIDGIHLKPETGLGPRHPICQAVDVGLALPGQGAALGLGNEVVSGLGLVGWGPGPGPEGCGARGRGGLCPTREEPADGDAVQVAGGHMASLGECVVAWPRSPAQNEELMDLQHLWLYQSRPHVPRAHRASSTATHPTPVHAAPPQSHNSLQGRAKEVFPFTAGAARGRCLGVGGAGTALPGWELRHSPRGAGKPLFAQSPQAPQSR